MLSGVWRLGPAGCVATPARHASFGFTALEEEDPMRNIQTVGPAGTRRGATARVIQAPASTAALRQIVAHLRQNRTQLCEEGARRITESRLLTAMTRAEILAEVASVYDDYVEL